VPRRSAMTDAKHRANTYPPPYPNGWFHLVDACDVKPGQVGHSPAARDPDRARCVSATRNDRRICITSRDGRDLNHRVVLVNARRVSSEQTKHNREEG
jgi:hypothetical protein